MVMRNSEKQEVQRRAQQGAKQDTRHSPERVRERSMRAHPAGSLRSLKGSDKFQEFIVRAWIYRDQFARRVHDLVIDERGDVPGWVLVVLMTTGLVTGIWTIAAPKIESLLRSSLDSMNSVR